VEDCPDLAAGGLDEDAEVAVGLGMGGDLLDGEIEIAVIVFGEIVGEVH
jgi:hypothetical protein